MDLNLQSEVKSCLDNAGIDVNTVWRFKHQHKKSALSQSFGLKVTILAYFYYGKSILSKWISILLLVPGLLLTVRSARLKEPGAQVVVFIWEISSLP